MEILVFKTNLVDETHIAAVHEHLNVHPQIHQWNVDVEDCDKVLRIVSSGIKAKEVEKIVGGVGYYCKEIE